VPGRRSCGGDRRCAARLAGGRRITHCARLRLASFGQMRRVGSRRALRAPAPEAARLAATEIAPAGHRLPLGTPGGQRARRAFKGAMGSLSSRCGWARFLSTASGAGARRFAFSWRRVDAVSPMSHDASVTCLPGRLAMVGKRVRASLLFTLWLAGLAPASSNSALGRSAEEFGAQ
jgi:hypothetical protein